MRIGLLGGAFNPPHVGHLLCAQEAGWQLGLDRVLLVPVHTPGHKELDDDPGPDVRLELCRVAVGDDPKLGVSEVEVARGGTSWTVDTLRALHERAPQDELTFVVGGDAAASVPTWREPTEVLRLARLAVAERGGARRADVLARVGEVEGADLGRVTFFDLPRIDVSSSLVRRRVREGGPLRWLVPDGVAAEIGRTGLYAS